MSYCCKICKTQLIKYTYDKSDWIGHPNIEIQLYCVSWKWKELIEE